MSFDITRVNWAITTFLVSYSLLMTNEEQKEAKIAYVSIPQAIMTITWIIIIIRDFRYFSAEIV